MSRYAVTHLGEIAEISDGRCPSRPVRHHFGITSFGVNAWTGTGAGDRIINEHDEAEEEDGQEELYLVQSGRARFEIARTASPQACGRMTARLRCSQISPYPLNMEPRMAPRRR
jgi:hypothetical protein